MRRSGDRPVLRLPDRPWPSRWRAVSQEGLSMSEQLPEVYLARHGETEWTITHRHTGRTDIPLTEQGERNARCLGERLRGLTFTKVLTSPMRRARQTAELVGFGQVAEVDPDLREWDYGRYEGLTTA